MTKTESSWGDFEAVDDAVNYRLVWRSYGPEKTGKNHFGLTAPGPIAIQSFDIGLEGMVEKFATGAGVPKREIKVRSYAFDAGNTSKSAAEELREKFIADFQIALKKARTIIWDTETELWELFRHAEFGLNQQGVASDAPKDYVKLNAAYRDLIQLAYDTGVNLQLIQKVKEKWTTYEAVDRDGRKVLRPQASGVYEPTGFKEAGYIVQMNLQHSWEKERGFVVKLLNCRQNMTMAGEEFTNITFPELATVIFGEESEEAWR